MGFKETSALNKLVLLLLLSCSAHAFSPWELDPYFELKGKTVAEAPIEKKKHTFSNTQSWDPVLLKHLQLAPQLLPAKYKITIPPPPEIGSERNQRDLEHLKALQEKRTPEDIEVIKSELYTWQFKIGDRVIYKLKDDGYPETAKLLKMIEHDLGLVILGLKKNYNRVRPSFIEKTLKPAIEIPPHPAYPSGHSMQAYTFALIFSELNPQMKSSYMDSAFHIAKHRELAGVHYPSDSLAGFLVARQFVDLLMNSKKFHGQFLKAKKEFIRHP